MTIGEKVVLERKKQGISQMELAYMACIDRSNLGRIERGECNPTIGTVERIEDALNLPCGYLSGSNRQANDTEEKIIREIGRNLIHSDLTKKEMQAVAFISKAVVEAVRELRAK